MFLEILIVIIVLLLSIIYYITTFNKREKINLVGKHVVVTGGSSGIGFDLCVEAFKQGAHVTAIARHRGRLESIRNELESIKNKIGSSQIIHIESLDISKSFEETKKVFDKIENVSGPVDVLINNAGIFKCIEFSDTPPEDFELMMKTNYLGSVYCTKSIIESMKKRRFGVISFVSSDCGQIGVYGYTGYCASKFALKGFAEALQMELKPYNIYVNTSYPPDTDTPGLIQENLKKPEETRIISATSGVYSSKTVANKIIQSIKNGDLDCYFGINGLILTIAASGASRAISFKEAVFQIIGLPFCRFFTIISIYGFDGIVKECFSKKTKLR